VKQAPLKGTEARLVGILGRVAIGVAIAVGVALPSFYFFIEYRSISAELVAEVEVNGDIVSRSINNNPEMWQYELHRLKDILDRRMGSNAPEIRRIRSVTGEVIEQSSDKPLPPILTRSAILYDSGACAGHIEISRSLRGLLRHTAAAGFVGVLLGAGIYALLMLVPMRLLKRALASLSEEKERSHVTLHAIGEAVISTGADGKVHLMNAVAERLTGWRAGEAEGLPLRDVFQTVDGRTGEPLSDPLVRFRANLETESVLSYALQTSRSGQMRRIAASTAPIREEGGALQGMVVVFRDITDQQRMEEELLKAQKLESVGVLAGGIAHDFNNILGAILGNISLAMEQAGPASPAHARLTEAGKACQRARDLTSQLLTFSRGGAPVRKTGAIGALVRESANFAMVGAKARCEIDVAGDLWPADIDEGQIGQVVHNLVRNADQAMPGGGAIRIQVMNATVDSQDPFPVPPGRYVKISVRDEGNGILPEHLASIFDPYFTTKREGSGLGLAVCFNVVKNHGGHITVRSEPGEGATFEFLLPASAKPGVSGAAEEKDAAKAGSGRVLVMDDDAAILEVAGEMLRHLAYEPSFARDGAEAIALYREAAATGTPFSAVIMDLTIPGGMGGREAVRALLEVDPEACVIVSSGYSNDPVMSDYKAHGFRGVVAKPYLIGTLSAVLAEVLGACARPPA
jgi:PAS domain S-box-containing protein